MLARYQVLDTLPEPGFDDLARLASQICGTPVALITFADANRFWFKSRIGLSISQADATNWFCAQTIQQTSMLVVPDAATDPRFASHPLVVGAPRFRFYAGQPLVSADGLPVGTLCVLDWDPHPADSAQTEVLRTLARQVMTELELRRCTLALERGEAEHQQTIRALREAEEKYRGIFENVMEGIFQTTPEGHYLAANPMLAKIYGYESAEQLMAAISNIEQQLYVEPRRREEFQRLLQEQDYISEFESQIYRRDGSIIWISENARAVRDAAGKLLYYEGTVENITKRKLAEETLRYSELRFRSVWSNSADGMRLTDRDGTIRAVNPAYCRIVGMAAEELEGRPFTVVYAASEDLAGRMERFRSRFVHKVVEDHLERHFTLRNGRQIDVELSNSFLELAGGDPMLLSIFHDITVRKQTENALRDSEVLYHSLVENLPQHMFRKDLKGRITFGNKRYCDELKQPLGDLLGKTDFDLFPAELATKYRHDDRRVMELDEVLDTVEEHQKPDGSKIYVHVIKTALRDATGTVVGVQGMFWDVTAQKLTEQQLAFERDLLRALLDNVPDRIYFKDRHSRFLKCSLALARRLALADPEAVVGKSDFEFHPWDAAKEFFDDEQRIIETGEPLVNKIERQTGLDGSAIWASVTKVPIRNRSGKITGIIGISRDITALKHAEEELAKARDQALETARLKSEFLAIMSHEIRTPMNGIIGMTGLLLETNLSSEQRDFTETVRESANALLDIINDILDFSKIEAGKLVLERVDFDLREVVESTVELLAERAQFKGLELISLITDDVPTALRGDPGRVRQVLLNLVGNAIKFTERGDVLVKATRERETESDVQVRLSVIDTGIGIDQETQKRIFQPFTQADSSTTRKYGGTGLGLAICKQLIEMLGGEIHVTSDLNHGSTFWFSLRLEKQPAGSIISRHKRADLAGLRVLIADDNATNREILEHQTAAWKMVSLSAKNGPQTLEILRRESAAGRPFDLALLDMQMPGMDGLTLARAIKADPTLASPRLVLLTSLGHRIDSATLSDAGIDCCLLKPVKQSRLYECLALMVAEPGGSGQQAGGRHPRPAGSPAPKNMRILLAEDNTVNQKVALLQLSRLGYKADTVADGSEALEALKQIPYDIILMDCHMPVMDGYEATRRIRLWEQANAGRGNLRPPVHIVAMTANALDGDRDECLAAGMNDYITKPTQLEDLDAALRRAPRKTAPSDSVTSGGTEDAILLDRSVVHGLRELREPGQPDPVAELIDLFLADAPNRLQALTGAVGDNDAGRIKAAAHALKGSAINLGAQRLAGCCAALESNAREGRLDDADQRLNQIKRELEQLRELLIEERQR